MSSHVGPSDELALVDPLIAALGGALSQGHPEKPPGFLTLRNYDIVKVFCFKQLSLGGIHYRAIVSPIVIEQFIIEQ